MAICTCSLPARSSTVLYSNLGTGSNVYNDNTTWGVTSPGFGGTSVADKFAVGGTGTFSVGQIDLAVTDTGVGSTFYAAIWTDIGGEPGSEVTNAYWSESAASDFPNPCCNLVSITDILGVSLTGGQDYFLILGALGNDTRVEFDFNNQAAADDEQYSLDGGTTWNDNGTQTLGAFDVLGAKATPEPSLTLLLLCGAGLIGFLQARCRKSQ
jgi:hypothetical protein